MCVCVCVCSTGAPGGVNILGQELHRRKYPRINAPGGGNILGQGLRGVKNS